MIRRPLFPAAAALALACATLSACNGDATSHPDDGGGPPDGAPGPLALAAGEAVELAMVAGPPATTSARLATPAGSEQFLVVLASTRFDTTLDTLDYTFSVGGAAAIAPGVTRLAGCALDSAVWKDTVVQPETPPAGPAPLVGDRRVLSISTGAGAQTFDAEVAAVGERAVVWVDVSKDHPANLDPTVIADFLADFDALILPRERSVFGVESDLDGDGRVGLVFTPLTKQTAVAFFTGCDLAPLAGCPQGNGGEFLYLTPPAVIDPPYNTPAAIKEVLAHECGHLVHFNRKVLRNHLTAWHDSGYMIEGFGALAQDTIGFQAGNLYVTVAGLDGIDDISLGDILTDDTAYDLSRDGVLRGASYLFTRYLYDRAGGDHANPDGTISGTGGPALLRALLDGTDTVATALPRAGMLATADLGMDFYTALAMSNREVQGDAAALNPCFRYLPTAIDPRTGKQRGADLFASFHGMSMHGPAIQDAATPDGSLFAGGVELIALPASTGASEVSFTLSVGGDAAARVRVARIR